MDPVIYNPADEDVPFTFGAVDRVLPANSFVVLTDKPDGVGAWLMPAEYVRIERWKLSPDEAKGMHAWLVQRYAPTGLQTVDDWTEQSFQEAFARGERIHEEWLRATLTPVLARRNKAIQAAKDAGLTAPGEKPEYVRAAKLAKEWGLLA